MFKANGAREYTALEKVLQDEFTGFHLIAQTRQLHFLFTVIRNRETARADFVFHSERIIRLVVEAALNFVPVAPSVVVTPTGRTFHGCMPDERGIVGISIMRAGEAMERVLRETCRGIRIGKILVQRDESKTDKTPNERYSYSKIPNDVANRHVLLLDPMIATGGSAIRATEILLNEHKVQQDRIIFLSLIACPEGIREYLRRFPGIAVVSAALDEALDANKYIVPGLGDFGDRYFGTCE
ncbi:putative Uracil phosphoribosyltransferase [Trypanosoma vivax]|nr:uracil phosphoribosyltransferase [Trypanosoma vivax]KAH8607181.1 putative Uracil phosphoribosyltransferase [Trypanosoma vivax]